MDTVTKQRVCGLLGGISYVSTVDVSNELYRSIFHYFLLRKVLQSNESNSRQIITGT